MSFSINLLIDELGSGGAQRQMCMLALELAKRGHSVQIICYYPNTWFYEHLLSNNIPVRIVCWRNQFEKLLAVRRALRERKTDAIISFLKGPNMINIMSSFPYLASKVIVSERNRDLVPLSLKSKICFRMYQFADFVVVNSHSQLDFLRSYIPYISSKVELITNGVDLEKGSRGMGESRDEKNNLVFGILASYCKRKRLIDLILAVDILARKLGAKTPRFIWHGENRDPVSGKVTSEFQAGSQMISGRKLERFIELRGPTSSPEKFLREVDCVCLVSEREGFPNVICEAFASGKPAVATRVGDTPYLIADGKTGFLAEPRSPESLASALLKMMSVDSKRRAEMGQAARCFAEQNLSIERFCDQYLELICN